MTDHPTFTLAGKSYPCPPLVPAQQRIVVPALYRLGGLARDRMTTEHYDDLLRVVYFGAMKKAEPSLKFEDLMEMPIQGAELLEAVRVVQGQTGLFQTRAQEPATGEREAARP